MKLTVKKNQNLRLSACLSICVDLRGKYLFPQMHADNYAYARRDTINAISFSIHRIKSVFSDARIQLKNDSFSYCIPLEYSLCTQS